MQDKDTEAINNQRKRRKRIGRIRNGIIMTIAGWIILSMILIIVLFVQVIKSQFEGTGSAGKCAETGKCRGVCLYRCH